MNRTLKLALGVVLGLGLVMPAAAQNFPDIPDNHWAYQALANLKGKVLFGYPDGLYRPARPMSRAEFAVAVNQLYQIMMAKDASLDAAIAALNNRVTALENRPVGSGGISRQEFDALKAQVTELQNAVNGMRAWGTDINNLKRLTAEFERELAAMDVDIDAMKRDMADMLKRLEALEGGGGPANFMLNGDGNLVVIAGHATDSTFGLTKTGRLTGYGEDDFDGVDVGMSQDLNVYHEFNASLSGKAGDNVSWIASMNIGNMVGWHDFAFPGSGDGTNFGDLNSQNAGTSFTTDVDNFMYFDQMNASFDTSIAGQGFKGTVGRFRHSSGPFFFMRPDYTEFYNNDRWDNGEFIMDGGMLEFMFGSVNLTAFATRNSDIYGIGASNAGLNRQELDFDGDGSPDWTVDSMLGVELGLRFGDNGGVKGVYYWQDSYDVSMGVNRMNTFGGQIDYRVGSIDLYAVYAQTDYRYNTTTVLDDDNTAWAAWASYDGGRWGADAGYARVEGNFGAFGSWGRLGTIFNPRNIEGFGGGLWFQINDRFKISGGAAMFDGAEDAAGLFGVPLTTDDSVTSYHVKLDWMMNSAWNVMLGYENVMWDVGTDPELRWWNVGLKHNLSDRANISINYLLGDVDFKGFGALDPFGADVYKGGVLSTQVSFRY
jgi:hypothetical protein